MNRRKRLDDWLVAKFNRWSDWLEQHNSRVRAGESDAVALSERIMASVILVVILLGIVLLVTWWPLAITIYCIVVILLLATIGIRLWSI